MFSATLIFFNFGVSLLDDDEAALDFRSVFDPDFGKSFLAGLSGCTTRSKVLTCLIEFEMIFNINFINLRTPDLFQVLI